ncbi:unnamed protein product [Onchocerca flexuosa]|uniref:Transmembrane protein n=1 Tax=Onchocerca flexuosa TaxID=387005 RepID=A0A183H3K3_9BILA|nr:unnamed protein product [Onchocerca flexuosa]
MELDEEEVESSFEELVRRAHLASFVLGVTLLLQLLAAAISIASTTCDRAVPLEINSQGEEFALHCRVAR